MRLLELDKDGELSLTEHFGDPKPQYAILSHTWGARDEEVTFRDVIDGASKRKAGYNKIQFCGEQASRDGLQYFWVDTCCIDKTNSTELQEAINSMFSWYRDSTKCYVYLSDVSVPDVDENHQLSSKIWELSFEASRWFTRGWTLQELIAPRTVEFFSKESRPLGDKKSLEQMIHRKSGIALEALRGDQPLHEFSIDERMSWAKYRRTTRQEDAAYCLMGIFDIFMPLIYGEGRENSLIRLRKHIQESQNLPPVSFKHAQTWHLLATSENRIFKTFASSFNDAPVDLLSIHFIERERELDLLRNAYRASEESAHTRCAIWGIPGVGKTQLAIQYTKIFLEVEAVSAVFWISCSSVEKLHQGFSKILELIDHPDQLKPEQNARVVAARGWLEQPEVSGIVRWLLVLDNVDITTLEFLRENLPRQGRQGRILITTRTEAVAHAVCKVSGRLHLSFELEQPVIGDALIFFLKSAGVSEASISAFSRRQIIDLINDCLGRLPLAIEHAASFMIQSSQTIDSLTRLYRGDQKSHIFDWQNLFSAYESKSISGIFAPHIYSLKQSSPEILGLLNILVFWDPDRIDCETIKTGALSLHSSFGKTKEPSKSEHKGHWKQLFASSLATISRFEFALPNKGLATGTSSCETKKNELSYGELEPLIKLVSSEVQLQSALQKLQMLSFLKRRSAQEGGAYCMHDLTQTLVQVALESEGTSLQWFRCAVRIACGAFHQIENPAMPESWNRCEGLILHILSLAEYSELVDPKNAELLSARGNIAAYWSNRGRYFEARDMYQQILGIGNNALHDAGIEITQWKLGLAEVNWHLGQLDESILLYEEVRQSRESRLGADHPDTLHVAENLALVYRSQARFSKARSMLEHVLESRKTSLGPDHLDTIQAIEYLAMTINEYAEAENAEAYAEAESLHKQALAHREAQLGTDHLDTLWTADNLATNYRAQGRHLEAVEIYGRVLEGRRLQLGEDHPQTVWTLANIASAYTSLGRLNEAEVMWKQAIVGNEQRRGHSHSETLFAVEGLADVYHRQSLFEEAIDLYNRALSGNEESLGDGHPNAMRIMHKLANLYRDHNDFIKSIKLFERLLVHRKTRLRSGHPDLLRTYHDAATLYTLMGNYIEAEECYRIELAGSIEELGAGHPETEKRELNLAAFLRDQKLQAEAAEGGARGAVANEGVVSGKTSLNDRQE